MKKLIWIFVATIAFASCDQASTEGIWKFYPDSKDLQKGVVNKYYENYTPINNDRKSVSNISYSHLKKDSDSTLTIKSYNAGYQLVAYQRLIIDHSTIKEDSFASINNLDTARTKIVYPLLYSWHSSNNHFKRVSEYSDWIEEVEIKQSNIKDSLIDNRLVKVIGSTANSRVVYDGDTTERSTRRRNIYAEGLGIIKTIINLEEWTMEAELVEQMPMEAFEKLKEEKGHRVAYIDPSKVLDKERDFEICGHELKIADYYNSNDDKTGFKEGKKKMVEVIIENTNMDFIPLEKSMLTFRFVVNCNGQAGRFVAQGYDQEFNFKEFSPDIVNHFFKILSEKLLTWNPCVIRGDPSDAYFYVTLKFDNGEIVDILP